MSIGAKPTSLWHFLDVRRIAFAGGMAALADDFRTVLCSFTVGATEILSFFGDATACSIFTLLRISHLSSPHWKYACVLVSSDATLTKLV